MKLLPGSFIDSQFRASETDLLFSAPLAEVPCFFYLLFEHQTNRDPWLGLRLLRYMVRIWEGHCERSPKAKKLPPVLPVVLAQNAERWVVDTRFSAMMELPGGLEDAFAPYIPSFSYRLLQLAEMPFAAIQGTPAGILILRTLKAERLDDLLNEAVWDEVLLAEVPQRIFELVLRYILGCEIDTTAFRRKISDIVDTQTRSTAMTLADRLRQEGRQEGREEGSLRSLRRSVVEALELRIGPVPDGLREAVDGIGDEEKLRLLHRTAITCATLEDFASGL